MYELLVIKGVECYIDEEGIVQLRLEHVARGLGFVQQKNDIEYIRWDRVNNYLKTFNFSPQVGKEQFIPEPIFYLLSMKAENEKARAFQYKVAYEILPQIRKTGTYSVKQQIPFKEQVECIDIIANSLKVNDASKILMYDILYKDYNLPTNFLPQYELNGSKELKSATELLKKFDLKLSTIAFNNLMIDNGYLEEKTRNSAKETSKIKKYKALTEKGPKYGENAVSPQNQREVQPLYYTDTFKELFDVISGKVGAVL